MNYFTKYYSALYILVIFVTKSRCDDDSGTCQTNAATGELHCKELHRIPPASNYDFAILGLTMTNCSKLIFTDDDFQDYVNLTTLRISSVDMAIQPSNLSLNKFAHLMKLQRLEFVNSSLTDDHMWMLPPNLKVYDVQLNNYTYLNVSMCPHITQIYANLNKLLKPPVLYDPTPPIEILQMVGNPLDDLSVEYLAPLCQLRSLQWTPINDTSLSSVSNACRCMRITMWAKKFNITGIELVCFDLPKEVKCDLTFSDIKHLRKRCPDVETIADASMTPQITLLKTWPPPLMTSASKMPSMTHAPTMPSMTPAPAMPSMTPAATMPSMTPAPTMPSMPLTTSKLPTTPTPISSASPMTSTSSSTPIPFENSIEPSGPTLPMLTEITTPQDSFQYSQQPIVVTIFPQFPDPRSGVFMLLLGVVGTSITWLVMILVLYLLSSGTPIPAVMEEEDITDE